ncbi:3-keto-disaccharide hydrolase [Costertonia aggregata]|uniref:DUF1080 domain-containing protein n=1 Tax=Costertonia aggregata TaxID=343403 RepID=A0A7H9ASK7_9FLAO|nr:DUF1080 domain-containing protein [Costertonia aggregata]QLG46416.1 DUF1080 domain-containing protein [Costertonia aggregata]
MNRFTITFLSILFSFNAQAQEKNPLEGRWNLTIQQEGRQIPSWLEISHSGHATLVGRFVYEFGSARPISEIKRSGDTFTFTIPRQWEPEGVDMQFTGKLKENVLNGTMMYTDGNTYDWTAVPAPKLEHTTSPEWGKTKSLFNGKNLDGWKATGKNQWEVVSGTLTSPKPGSNLVSEETFTDFKLHVEFKYPEGSNSGIYLRGRYEVQIADNVGLEPSSIYFGGIYGFLTPNQMMAKPAGEWQTYDITLIGRRVTIVANGNTIICEQNIPGMTGGALDNDEAAAGPIMLQGDHGPITFRKIEITPVK